MLSNDLIHHYLSLCTFTIVEQISFISNDCFECILIKKVQREGNISTSLTSILSARNETFQLAFDEYILKLSMKI